MSDLRAAAQQALEALKVIDKEFRRHGRQHWPEAVKARVASPAIRAALAEPVQKPLTEAQIYAAIKSIDSLKAVEVARAIERAHGIGDSNE